jgi:hypothetical protein
MSSVFPVPEPVKNPHWKQANPVDQLVVLLNGMEGNLLSLEDGIITADTYSSRMEVYYDQCRDLIQFLREPKLWQA